MTLALMQEKWLTRLRWEPMNCALPDDCHRAKADVAKGCAIAYAIGLPLALLALVFLPVGRLDWAPGWFFIAFVIVGFSASALILARVNPAIYRARSRFQPGTKRWDIILLWLMLPAMVAEVPLATLDAGRMLWSDVPPFIVVLGYVLLGASMALTTWAQAVNRFFEPGVRLQRERGQHVIRSGPYAFVRHPGYVGALMMFVGIPRARLVAGVDPGRLGQRHPAPADELGRCAAARRARRL